MDNLITPATQDEIDRIRGYFVEKWKKYDNFRCIHCQYATLWEGKMQKHQAAEAHFWPYPGPPLPEGVVSPDEDDNVPIYE
jgi:hypothetical protein